MGRAQLLSILLTTLMTSAQTAVRERVIRKADPISGELAEVMRGWAAVIGLDSPVTTSQLEELVGNGPHRTLDESDDEWKLRQQHFAEFRDERGGKRATKHAQRAGIAHAQATNAAAYRGLKPSFSREQFDVVQANLSEIARQVGIHRMAVARIKADPAASEAMLANWHL